MDTPQIKAFEARVRALEGRTAEAAGVLNAAHGVLVEVAADLLGDGSGALGEGVHTAAKWLAWQAELSPARAGDVERLARRRSELPVTVAAVVAGSLSLEQATVIAKWVPTEFERSACEVATACTVAQLRATLPNYDFDYDSQSKPPPDPETKEHRERSLSSGTDARGWWARLRAPLEEGEAIEAALAAKREQLYQANKELDGDNAEKVDGLDALLAMAESSLMDLDARLPGTDRYVVNLHLEAHPDTDASEAAMLWLHQRGAVTEDTRRFLTCDAQLRATLYRDGVAFSTGRTHRVVNRPLRRNIEHRDRGCIVPGCGRRRGIEVHHIIHWEDGGPTTTHNLVSLCRRHHRAHHHGQLGIHGNPDLPTGTPGALRCTTATGHPMTSGAHPTTPTPGASPAEAATAIGLPPAHYVHPLGERLDWDGFWITYDTPKRPPDTDPGSDTDQEPDPATTADQTWDHTDHHPPPGSPADGDGGTDPTRAGPR